MAYLWPWLWWDWLILRPQASPKICLCPQNPLVPEEVTSLAPDRPWGQVQRQGELVRGLWRGQKEVVWEQ